MGSHAEVEMPHDENDPFVKRVALSIAVFAVVLALAAAGGNNAGKDMMKNQLSASNEWNQYQAKRLREGSFETEKEQMDQQFGPLARPKDIGEAKKVTKEYEAALKEEKLSADPNERRKARHRYLAAKLSEYEDDKAKLTEKAKKFEADRDLAHKKDPFFDTAELLLQIGIVLASVAMLSKARWAFVAGCVLGVGGLVLTVMGYFFPDVAIPFLTGGEGEAAGH